MKTYKYKARKSPTELVEGTVTAASQDAAVEQINALGLLPIDLDEVRGRQLNVAQAVQTVNVKPKSREITIFFRQLARMIKSGLPLLNSLVLLQRQAQSDSMLRLFESVQQSVREGIALSSALHHFKKAFNLFEISLIQAGESVGQLDLVLSRIADYRDKQDALISKVRASIVYPLFIFAVGLGTVIFMLAVVIPRFAEFFEDLGQDLPLATRFLLWMSQFTQGAWAWVLIAAAAFFFVFRQSLADPGKKLKWDRLILGFPQIGPILLKSELSRFARTLQLLLHSGIPLLKAVKITVPVIQNGYLRHKLQECSQNLEGGSRLSDGIAKSDAFPQFVAQLIQVGEESGKLDETLGDIADWYEEETSASIKWMTQLLEPVFIMVVGLILGFIIVAVLLPIFSLNAMVT